jgi:pimeloyl-ACP methyl ester carboxylesterase
VLRLRPAAPRATVVVVHGAMDRSAGFRRTARRLPDLDVVLYDRRGYAGSLHAGTADTIDAQLDDLCRVLEAVRRDVDDRPLVVVGHSLGGLLALHLAAVHPTALQAVGSWEAPLPWLDWYVAETSDRARSVIGAADPADAAEGFMRHMIGDALWERLPKATRAERRAEGPALVIDLELGRTPAAVLDFGRVTVPTVSGCGGQSSPRFRRAASHVMEHAPDGMLVEVADADHGAHLTHPDEFAAFVQAIVARVG